MTSDLNQLLIVSGVFVVVTVGVIALYRLVTVRRRAVAERLEMIHTLQAESARADLAPQLAARWRPLESVLSRSSLARRLERRLTTAGVDLTVSEYVVIVTATTAVGALVGLVGVRSLLLGAVLGGVGFWFPNFILGVCEARRKALLEKQLATAVRLVAASMQAGHGFQTGLATAAEQLPEPISGELSRVVVQVNRGISVEVALRQLANRIDSYDFELFVNAVAIQFRTGGRVTEILENISTTIRQRIALQREVSAASAQGKLSGGVLVAIPLFIAGALLLINRQYAMLLFTDPLGQTMVKAALIMQVMGIFVIRRLLRLRV